jgi:hypothetical protein
MQDVRSMGSEKMKIRKKEGLKRAVEKGLVGLMVAFLSFRGYSQYYPGHDEATAGASVGSPGVSRLWFNPASQSESKALSFYSYYQCPYMLKELSVKGFGITAPFSQGSVSAHYYGEGYTLFNKQALTLGYSRRFGKNISAGMTFDYLSVRIGEGYGSMNGLGSRAGMLFQLSPALWSGMCAFFPAGNSSVLKECFQPFILWGLRWRTSPRLDIFTEIAKEIQSPAKIRGGLCLQRPDMWLLQGGMNLFPASFFLGYGYTFWNFSLTVNTSYISLLGFSPSVSMVYEWKK